MKKRLIIIILSCISTYSFSQSFSDKKIEIDNADLGAKISDYIRYVKNWAAPKKDVRNYLITLDQQRLGESTIFTLNAILFSSGINRFSPSAYTVINETPVLIHSGIENFVLKDDDFFKFLKETYWKNIPDAEIKAYIDKQMKAAENEMKNMPDSVMIYNEPGGHKVPKSDIRPNIIPFESTLHQSPPKSWILYFKGTYLQRETEDRHEMKSQ